MPVLRFVTGEYADRGLFFDEVWLLMACAPLVNSGDLIAAANLFSDSGSNTPVLAVTEYPAPIEWAFRRKNDGSLTAVQPGMFALRSQDIEKCYFDSGSFAVFPSSRVLSSEGAGSDVDLIGYVLPKNSVVDIDDEEDWKFAELLFRSMAMR
jgi:CMP-N-acetylneuraminic acid synthetase